MPADREKMDHLLETKGEDEIREMLATKVISGRNAEYLHAKLERLDRERAAKIQAELEEVAKSSRDAAWAAAEEASKANQHSKTSNIIALIALVVAIVAAIGAFWPDNAS